MHIGELPDRGGRSKSYNCHILGPDAHSNTLKYDTDDTIKLSAIAINTSGK